MPSKPAILLLTPPLVPPNAPYPATPFLTAALRRAGWRVAQADLSIELLHRLFARDTLELLAETARDRVLREPATPRHVAQFLAQLPRYLATVEPVLAFLGGRSNVLPGPLPEGPRFQPLRELLRIASPLAASAAADPRLRASLYLDDLADALRDGVDPRFAFGRYAEQLATSPATFDALAEALAAPPSPIDRLLDELATQTADRHAPDLVGITVPFPGNLYAACRIAQAIRRRIPAVRILFGGGYVSTELRAMTDLRLFDVVDALCYDDGEQPLLRYVEAVASGGRVDTLPRIATRLRPPVAALAAAEDGSARLRHRDRPAPTYDGLPLDRYLAVAESPNPMHRLWSEQFWNKLALAHGCYWHRCAFCDTSLDYIARYDPADVETVLRWMDALHAETGKPGFHFVDEAAPPALLRQLALRLAERGAPYRWWTNLRLERGIDAELARTLAAGGCIAVSAGLECATDRLLARMNKGLTLADAVRACAACAAAGLMVHVYLMYGFPSQTAQDTVDALELVRQLFARGAIHSAYWHRFALTCHSPVFAECQAFGLEPRLPDSVFAHNEVPYAEALAPDHAALGEGLRTAVYNYRLGVGLQEDVRAWFPCRVPRPGLPRRWLRDLLGPAKPSARARSMRGPESPAPAPPSTECRSGCRTHRATSDGRAKSRSR